VTYRRGGGDRDQQQGGALHDHGQDQRRPDPRRLLQAAGEGGAGQGADVAGRDDQAVADRFGLG
jgi:hypothetical protein